MEEVLLSEGTWSLKETLLLRDRFFLEKNIAHHCAWCGFYLCHKLFLHWKSLLLLHHYSQIHSFLLLTPFLMVAIAGFTAFYFLFFGEEHCPPSCLVQKLLYFCHGLFLHWKSSLPLHCYSWIHSFPLLTPFCVVAIAGFTAFSLLPSLLYFLLSLPVLFLDSAPFPDAIIVLL